MAVFPQSIVFKTSQDDPAVIAAAASVGGDNALMRGEIVMGIESGRVQLYAQDINGNAVSLVPPVPGYDISGNSIFDLVDVTFTSAPDDGDSLVWDSSQNAFLPKEIRYADLSGTPDSLDDFINPGGKYLTKGSIGLNGNDLNNVNKSDAYDDLNIPNGVYLQYSSSLGSWEYVTSIAADISGNSIFDFSNVYNPNGADNPPPNSLNYLRWDTVRGAYVPSRIYIEEDNAPSLSADLDFNGKDLVHISSGKTEFTIRSGSQLFLNLTRTTSTLNGDGTDLDSTPTSRVGLDLEIPGWSESGATSIALRSPGNLGVHAPSALSYYEYIDNGGNIRRQYNNYNIILPQGPPTATGMIPVFEVPQADLDRDPFNFPNDRPTVSNPITAQLAYKKYEIGALDDVEIDEDTLELNSVLAYQPMLDRWINVPASGPGDLTANSIGDLRDVTLDLEGNITIDTVNRHILNGDELSPADTAYFGMDIDGIRGMTMAHYRESDGLGSYVHIERDAGVEINTYSSMVRLTGDRQRTDNRPELRFHYSLPNVQIPDGQGGFTPTPYVGLKLPSLTDLEEGEQFTAFTYNLPLTPPSADNQVLTCGPEGQWAWSNVGIDSIVVALGDLSDVDTATFPPANGRVLTYQGATSTWVPLDLPAITSALAELTDVSLSGIPSNGQYLRYNSAFQVWQNQEADKDWLIESPIYFQSRYSSAIGGSPPVGYWTVDQPSIGNSTLLKLNKTSDAGGLVGNSWIEILSEGVVILFSEQGNPQNYVYFTVDGNPIDEGGYYDIPVETERTFGNISNNTIYVCSVLAGSGGGGGGGGSASLAGLNDVDINPILLNEGQVLQYNKTAALWQATDAFARNLGDLTDVNLEDNAPEIGQALTWDGSEWIPGEGGGGSQNGEAVERLEVSAVASAVNPNQDRLIELLSIGQSGQFVSCGADKPAWIRFYSTAAARAADNTREIDEDPSPGSGVLLEVLTIAEDQTIAVTPGSSYFNDDPTPDDRIYVSVRNLDADNVQDITVNLKVYAAVTAKINKGRETFTSTGASVAPGGTVFQTLQGCGKMGSFISVQANADSWIRFYSTKAARTADQGRNQLVSPLPGSGVLMEIIATQNVVYQITPQVGYFNGEPDPVDSIYIAIDNQSGVFQPMTVNVEAVPLEGQILAAITGAVTAIDGGSFGSG